MPKKERKDEKKVKPHVPKEMVKKRGRPKKIEKMEKKEKVEAPKEIKAEKELEVIKPSRDYLFAVGRRKTAVARIRFHKEGIGEIIINNKDYRQYFPFFEFQKIVLSPLVLTDYQGKGKFSIKVHGGGKRGQAEGIRHGLSRLLIKISQEYRPILKKNEFLTRDARVKERKKYGLKRARKAPQWQKR